MVVKKLGGDGVLPMVVGQGERIGVAEPVVKHQAGEQQAARIAAALAQFSALGGQERSAGGMVERARGAAARGFRIRALRDLLDEADGAIDERRDAAAELTG